MSRAPEWRTDPVDEDRGRWFAYGRWAATIARPERGEWVVEQDPDTWHALAVIRRPIVIWFAVVAFLAGLVVPAVTVWAMGPTTPDPGSTCAYRPQGDPTGLLVWWLLWLVLVLVVVVGGMATRDGALRLRPEFRTRCYRIAAWGAVIAPPLWWLALVSGGAMNCGM